MSDPSTIVATIEALHNALSIVSLDDGTPLVGGATFQQTLRRVEREACGTLQDRYELLLRRYVARALERLALGRPRCAPQLRAAAETLIACSEARRAAEAAS